MFNAICSIINNVKAYNTNFYVDDIVISNSFGGEAMIAMKISSNNGGWHGRYIFRTNAEIYIIMDEYNKCLAKGNPNSYDDISRHLKSLVEGAIFINKACKYGLETSVYDFNSDDVMKLQPYYDMLNTIGNKFYILYKSDKLEISFVINTLTDEYHHMKRSAVIYLPSYEMALIDIKDYEENVLCEGDSVSILKNHIMTSFNKVDVMKHDALVDSIRSF